MKNLILPLLPLALSACIMTTSAGGYPANGKVVDKQSGLPIENVEIRLRYWANSPYGPHSKYSSSVQSDSEGNFRIPAEEVQLWGGTGGLAGRINEWPSVELTKAGYCQQWVSFEEPSVDRYQDMQLKMEPLNDNCR